MVSLRRDDDVQTKVHSRSSFVPERWSRSDFEIQNNDDDQYVHLINVIWFGRHPCRRRIEWMDDGYSVAITIFITNRD